MAKMNMLFLNPPFINRFSRSSRSPAVTKGGTLYYPIWLAYSVGVVEKAGYNVRFFDCPAEGLNMEGVFNRLTDFVPDMVVIDTSTPSIYNDTKIAQEFKRKYSESFIALVGTHPSALPEDTLKLSDSVNAVCIGEYEYTILDLIKALENSRSLKQIDGLVFRNNGEYIKNKERERIKNLDEIPFVSSVYKRYLNCKNYFFAAASYPMVMIITGRGCPYGCTFCVYPQVFHDQGYRTRSPENVVDEFEYIVKDLPRVKEIGIEDDTFTADIERVRKICNLLIGRKIKMKWYCNVRTDLDLETMMLMKKAGCRLVTVGFESSDQAVLDSVNKKTKTQLIKEFVKNAKLANLLIHGCFMAGNPKDTKETLMESFRVAKELNCDSMQFYPLFVYPGTKTYEWAEKEGFLSTNDFSRWVTEDGYHNCVVNNANLSSKEIVKFCQDATRAYHFKLEYLWMKLIQAIREPYEGTRTFRAALIYLKYVLKNHLFKVYKRSNRSKETQ